MKVWVVCDMADPHVSLESMSLFASEDAAKKVCDENNSKLDENRFLCDEGEDPWQVLEFEVTS